MTNTIYLLVFLFSLTLSSCGGGEHSATDTGSASFGLKFEEASATAMKLAPSMAPADICSSYGIDSISGTVYNSSNSVIATGGPWACSAHQGTINNIPPGSNLRIAVKGTVSGTVVWQGETTGATIYAGQDTNVGSISMTYIGNDTTRPTVSAATPTGTTVPLTSPITVTFSEAMAASTIDTTTFTLKNGAVAVPGSVTYNSTTRTATFTPTSSLSNSVIYTATVTTDVTDMAANMMQSLYIWNFTTEAVSDSTSPENTTAANFINSGTSSTNSTSVTLAISATDAVGVTAYYASETSTTPSSTASGWTAVTSTTSYSASVSFTLSGGSVGDNTKTVYVWFKDAAGYVSASASDSINLSVVVVHVPDTGQTGDYTTTFGEDSDYTINPPSYTDNGNGTITDNITGLLWQKQDDATTRTWTDAGTYCTNLSLAGTGWRLPTNFELMTILDYGKYSPSINTTYFPNTQSSSYYWSSSYPLVVGFFSGGTYSFGTTAGSFYSRCVRGGQ